MGGRILPNLKLIAVNFVLLCFLFISIESNSIESHEIPLENEDFENEHSVSSRFISMMLKRSVRMRYSKEASLELRSKRLQDTEEESKRIRRDDERELNEIDRQRIEYERRLFESLNIIGTVPATRLYVPEYVQDAQGAQTKSFNIEIGTVVGKVRKLFPHGKQLIVWPYLGWRNFTINENTGEVETTAKMDFELIRLYNMTIRDFKHNYSNPEPLKQPPWPDPLQDGEDPKRSYVDHYLIVEVVDRNDNAPKFSRDVFDSGRFSGQVNSNARAGTPILYVHPEDDDSGPRGRIRFNIKTDNGEQSDFTIDPTTHFLKTTGARDLRSGEHRIEVEALDYGMPPRTSGFQTFTVRVGKVPPEFFGAPYNLNFSEASVRGSVVGKIDAVSRSGMPIKYKILTEDVKDTFAINHLGELILLREIDYETANDSDKMFKFEVQAIEDSYQGRSTKITVTLTLTNADDHLGMFKTPAKQLKFKEGDFRQGGDIFTVEVEDCDCKENCDCKTGEMIYKIGDTKGFFEITSSGQIRNIKDLDYEKQNYFFFPVQVTDPGANGRTRTSYVEITVLDIDDTPPKFDPATYEFAIFEDAPKDQVVGVAQAIDPDPATKPDDITYRVKSADPSEGREYFEFGNQGVIKVLKNTNQFKGSDVYEFTVDAIDKGGHTSDPSATVKIRVLDVNDHQPVFKKCEQQSIEENQPIGTVLTKLTATDDDRGRNKLIEYSLAPVQNQDFFKINNQTGEVSIKSKLDREKYDEIFVVAKATDGGADRSELLRQIGYCQFIVKVLDVNDHHPTFTVAEFEVKILRSLSKGSRVLSVEAEDPDLGDNAVIEYRIVTQKKGGSPVDYVEIVKATGEVKVKSSMNGLNLADVITLVIEASNKKVVSGPASGDLSRTTVKIKFSNHEPPTFPKYVYKAHVKEDRDPSTLVETLKSSDSGVVFSLQTIRNRDNLPFFVESSTGGIKTSKQVDYELKKSYLFAVRAEKKGGMTSIIVHIIVDDVDDVVPIFGNDKYEATVSEAAKGGVNVFRVQASDPDPIKGDKIIYAIQSSDVSKYFKIEEKTGYAQITTAPDVKEGVFDREKNPSYTIILEAYRESAPKLKSTAILTVNIRDENDSPPKFVQQKYGPYSIAENIKVPYKFPKLIINATDKDILENGYIEYFITSGNDGRFSMETIVGRDQENTARLIISSPLDAKKSPEFEKNPVYTLTVTATDRKHTANATITIKVSVKYILFLYIIVEFIELLNVYHQLFSPVLQICYDFHILITIYFKRFE